MTAPLVVALKATHLRLSCFNIWTLFSMEAHFRHWIQKNVKKVIATFYLTILTFFFHRIVRYKLAIASYKLRVVRYKVRIARYKLNSDFFFSELHDINSQLRVKVTIAVLRGEERLIDMFSELRVSQFTILTLELAIVSLYHAILRKEVRIVR